MQQARKAKEKEEGGGGQKGKHLGQPDMKQARHQERGEKERKHRQKQRAQGQALQICLLRLNEPLDFYCMHRHETKANSGPPLPRIGRDDAED